MFAVYSNGHQNVVARAITRVIHVELVVVYSAFEMGANIVPVRGCISYCAP
jgi:hypothetical protein